MATIKITNLVNQSFLVDELSDKELETVSGGKTTVVSCNVDGTYTYSNGSQTWRARPWWMPRIIWH